MILNQVADEFVIPEIDGMKEAEIVPMDEPAPRIPQAFHHHASNRGGRGAGKTIHVAGQMVRIRTYDKKKFSSFRNRKRQQEQHPDLTLTGM